MNPRSLFQIGLIFLLTFFVMRMFTGEVQNTMPTGEVFVEIEKTEATVPSLPNLIVHNNTSEALMFNTCDNIDMRINGTLIEDKESDGYGAFCKDIEIPAGKKYQTATDRFESDFTPIASLFHNPFAFTFDVNIEDKKFTYNYNLSNQGAIKSFFTTVFYAPVYNLFIFFMDVLPGSMLGWAIICATLVVRLLLLVPQQKMLISQQRLQEVQPKIREIQTQYKDDQAKMGQELMALYKKEGVNPLGSCLPLLLQMPLLFVLYWVVIGIMNPQNTYYLYSYFTDFSLASVETMFYGISLIEAGGTVGLIVALIVGGAQYVQISLSQANKKKKDADKPVKKNDNPAMPDPELMQKMMKYGIPVMIAIFSYQFIVGVGLYWFTGTIVMILQQLVVNRKTK